MTSWNPGGTPEQPQFGQPAPQSAPQWGAPPAAPGAAGTAAPPPYQAPTGPNPYGYQPYPNQANPTAYGQPGQPLLPGATGPLNITNRVLAYAIDFGIWLVFDLVIYFVAAASIFAAASSISCGYDSSGDYRCSNVSAGAGAGIMIFFFLALAAGIALAVYYIYAVGKTGQTPGKKIMGVKVVDAQTGQPIGFGRSFVRILVQSLCNALCYAGLWSAFLDQPPAGTYRGWHDKAANTQVISVK